ncbi:hypothetical protein [Roseibium aggregatum]|uniref:Uncharacterized protein n=1 Tax=Roseibium aggregatum TaxID=187304 RepID=A0A939EF28_9HYPH|nr:hypothetical protein [Roseibium aggregatum]MBN9671629.1 hypothetical protein [Roseibium aggregatum]
MMSIGSMPAMPPSGPSPRDQIVSELEEQVEAGEITSEDQDAMLEALDAIHAERMEAGPPDFSAGPPSEEEMQANFESMLSEQVEAGTLDQDQADQLSEMFASGELGGPPAGGDMPPPPPPGGGESGSDSTEELMTTLLESLQSSNSYNESGDQATTSISSLLADYKV